MGNNMDRALQEYKKYLKKVGLFENFAWANLSPKKEKRNSAHK